MKSPFEKKFCGKSPLKELTAKQEANLPEALKTAIEASPNNYGSPLNQFQENASVNKTSSVDVVKLTQDLKSFLTTIQKTQAELDAAKFSLSQSKQA